MYILTCLIYILHISATLLWVVYLNIFNLAYNLVLNLRICLPWSYIPRTIFNSINSINSTDSNRLGLPLPMSLISYCAASALPVCVCGVTSLLSESFCSCPPLPARRPFKDSAESPWCLVLHVEESWNPNNASLTVQCYYSLVRGGLPLSVTRIAALHWK